MKKFLCAMIGLVLVFSPMKAEAIETVRVLVLPFDIYAQQDLAYLAEEIPNAIREDLRQEGVEALDPADIAGLSDLIGVEKTKGILGLRKIGLAGGADYVIWGSLTRLGQQFSLDAKVAATLGDAPPDVFFVEGGGLEELMQKVRKLTDRFSVKLLKREMIADIRIKGNKRIETDAIKRKIKTRAGDVYISKRLSEDLKALYGMGYFDDIRIESETGDQGRIVTFNVKEKASIRAIRIKGNNVYDDEKIKENLTISTGSILNVYKIQKNIERIISLYKEKDYHNVKVSHAVKPRDNGQADLEFTIEEGKKTRIEKITFVGNEAISNRKLKKIIKTSERGFFSWLTSSGALKKEKLRQDVVRLENYYHNRGYIQAKVGEPQIEFKEHQIYIIIKIDEGKRFKVGKVNIQGDLLQEQPALLKKIKIPEEDYYNQEVVRGDVLELMDLYSDAGYAYADISPKIKRDMENLTVDITFLVSKGKLVYFEKIIIAGNTYTRDKVIRRELKLYEQELFSGQELKLGVRRLYRLDYFDEVNVDTQMGSADDKMVLKIDVTEKPTGAFSFGGGYSDNSGAFLMASVVKRNFMGRGQTVTLKGTFGQTSSRYVVAFMEPWLFGIPLSAGFEFYSQTYEYSSYDKDSIGGMVHFGYPVYDFTRLSLAYNYDISNVHDIESSASNQIKEIEGENTTSAVTTTLRYDSRDRIFSPTEGSDHRITVEYAGLGGDFAYTKYQADTGWYVPVFWNTTVFLHGKIGYVTENSGGTLPDFKRFYLGGLNSIRGFPYRGITAKDANNDEIGGESMLQFNFEYLIPLFTDSGLVGVLFFDTGNVYSADDDMDLGTMRQSAGAGFRWYSPLGPLRLEYGYILDPIAGEAEGGRWEFSMGMAFF